MTDLIRKVAESTSSSSATPRSRRPYTCSQEWPPGTASEVIPGPQGGPALRPPWTRIPQNIGYDPPLNAIAGRFSAPCDLRSRYNGSFGRTGANLAQLAHWEGDGGPRIPQRGLPERLRIFVAQGEPAGEPGVSLRLRQPEDEQRITERVADLEIAARSHGHELLAVDVEHRGRGVGAGAAVELPQHRAGLGVVRLEPAVAFAGDHEPARRGGRAAHHRQLGFHAPRDLAGVQVDRVDVAVLTRVAALGVRDAHEGAAEPQAALFPRRVMDLVVHRLVQAHRVGVRQVGVHGDGGPLLATVRAREHEHAVGRRLAGHG